MYQFICGQIATHSFTKSQGETLRYTVIDRLKALVYDTAKSGDVDEFNTACLFRLQEDIHLILNQPTQIVVSAPALNFFIFFRRKRKEMKKKKMKILVWKKIKVKRKMVMKVKKKQNLIRKCWIILLESCRHR